MRKARYNQSHLDVFFYVCITVWRWSDWATATSSTGTSSCSAPSATQQPRLGPPHWARSWARWASTAKQSVVRVWRESMFDIILWMLWCLTPLICNVWVVFKQKWFHSGWVHLQWQDWDTHTEHYELQKVLHQWTQLWWVDIQTREMHSTEYSVWLCAVKFYHNFKPTIIRKYKTVHSISTYHICVTFRGGSRSIGAAAKGQYPHRKISST